jgi:hypothetical protein
VAVMGHFTIWDWADSDSDSEVGDCQADDIVEIRAGGLGAPKSRATRSERGDVTEFVLDDGTRYRFVCYPHLTPDSAKRYFWAELQSLAKFGLVAEQKASNFLQDGAVYQFYEGDNIHGDKSYFGIELPPMSEQQQVSEQALADTWQKMQLIRSLLEHVSQQFKCYPALDDLRLKITNFAQTIGRRAPDLLQAAEVYTQAQRMLSELRDVPQLSEHRGERHQKHCTWYSRLSPGEKAAIVLGLGIVIGAIVLLVLHSYAKAKTRSQKWVSNMWLRLVNLRVRLNPVRQVRMGRAPGSSVLVPHWQTPMGSRSPSECSHP